MIEALTFCEAVTVVMSLMILCLLYIIVFEKVGF